MTSQSKTIVFPVGGIHRSYAWQTQPPYTTIEGENVRSIGAASGRARGGSRPGMRKAFAEQMSVTPVGGTIASVYYDSGEDMSYVTTTALFMSGWMIGVGMSCTVTGNIYPIEAEAAPRDGIVDSNGYDSMTNRTSITATADMFEAGMVGWKIQFAPGTSHGEDFMEILAVVDATEIEVGDDRTVDPDTAFILVPPDFTLRVTGDASAEAGAITIPYGSPIQCIASVSPAEGTEASMVQDTFEGRTVGSQIYTAPWVASGVPDWPSGNWMLVKEVRGKRYAYAGTWYGGGPDLAASYACSCLLDAVSIASGTVYAVQAVLVPPATTPTHTIQYIMWIGMDDAAPTQDDCVKITVEQNVGFPGYEYKCWVTIEVFESGVVTSTEIVTGKTITWPCWLSAVVNGDDISVSLDGDPIKSFTHPALGGIAGSRVGLGMVHNEPLPGDCPMFDSFYLSYASPTVSEARRPVLFASANGVPYREDDSGTLVALTGNVDLHPSAILQTSEWGGRLFIADHDPGAVPRLELDACTISTAAGGAPGKVIKHATATFTGLGIDVDNDLCVVTKTGAGGGPPVGAYKIATVEATKLTLTDCGDFDDTGISIKVERAPKVFNPLTGTLAIYQQTITDAKPQGIMPTGCHLMALYRDRIVLAGNPPHVFYVSRAGDPWDWNFGDDPDDVARAYGGATGLAGMIGKPLTALVPFSDDYMILACENELWVMRGDPSAGGSILNISNQVGIVAPLAWARTPEGGLIFLGTTGLYSLAPGGNSPPVELSDRLPTDLRNINLASTWPMLAYEPRHDLIRVWLTARTADISGDGGPSNWVVDRKNNAFWVDRQQYAHDAMAYCYHPLQSSLGGKTMILGCRDGYVRRYADEVGTDDGAPFTSKVLLGPFRAGGVQDLYIEGLIATLGEGSGNVEWQLFSADSAEAAHALYLADTPSHAGGTWKAGRNVLDYVKHRDLYHYLLLKSPEGATARWEMDEVVGLFSVGGMYRPL